MKDFFKNLFGNKNAPKTDAEKTREKQLAQSEKINDRLKLAKGKNTSGEILYYLAQHDPDANVRRAVATNKSTPVQASMLLAKDSDIDVRLSLAERLIKLLPDLSVDRQSQLYAFVTESLGTLALDEVLKIRVALSSALKDHALAPPKVAGQLARDLEREVSEPVLRLCAALSDEDLIDILKTHPASWAAQAVASRETVTEEVSQAVIDRNDEQAGYILMGNKGAQISTSTLGEIVEKAKQFRSWQKPVACRKNLPKELAVELASFVDDTVRNLLLERTDYDATAMNEIATVVQRRMDFMNDVGGDTAELEKHVRELLWMGRLDDEIMKDAIGVRNRDFVVMALAVKSKTNIVKVEKIFALKSAKPIIALCWLTGFSMRTAFLIQRDLLLLPASELIYARGGTDYPLEEKDIKWQLDFLGLPHKIQ